MNRSISYITQSVFIIALSVNASAEVPSDPNLEGLPFKVLQQRVEYLEQDVESGQQEDTILQDNIDDVEAAGIAAVDVLQEQFDAVLNGSCPCWDASLLNVIDSLLVEEIPPDTEFVCSDNTLGQGRVVHRAISTSGTGFDAHYLLRTVTKIVTIVPSTGEPRVPTGDPAVIHPPSCRRQLQPTSPVSQIFFPAFSSGSDVLLEDISTQEAKACREILMASRLWERCG